MRNVFPPDWRTQSRRKRRFYAKYMRTLERAGYLLVCGVFGAFIFAFNYKVDDLVTADKVAIQPLSHPLTLDQPSLVVRTLAKDFDEVRQGQPLLEVVLGEEAISRFKKWQSVRDLQTEVGDSAEVGQLLARYPRPTTLTLTAPASGTFRIDSAAIVNPTEEKAPVARVVDYGTLQMSASLSGQTVAQAAVGQPARITSIAIDPEGGTLFRGSGNAGDAVSGRLLGERVKDVLQKDLVGKGVRLRDDIPLKVSEVSEVQVDANVVPEANGSTRDAINLDPPANYDVEAKVVSGEPAASVQVADLPPDVAAHAREAVRESVRGKSVRRLDGNTVTLRDADNVRLVVKLKADRAGQPLPDSVSATPLSRTFDAQLQLTSPPQFLIDAVRAADRTGKVVTGRVELRTGTRPIALILLKKS